MTASSSSLDRKRLSICLESGGQREAYREELEDAPHSRGWRDVRHDWRKWQAVRRGLIWSRWTGLLALDLLEDSVVKPFSKAYKRVWLMNPACDCGACTAAKKATWLVVEPRIDK